MSPQLSLHVSYREPAGPVAGPGVLMIHGYSSRAEKDFDACADALVADGHACALVDLPAHGESASPASSGEVSIDAVLAALRDAARVLGEGPFDVVGYSLGARLAWELAVRYPDDVRRVALGGFGDGDPFSMVDIDDLWGLVTDGTQPKHPITSVLGDMAVAQGERAAGMVRLIAGLGANPFVPSPQYSPSCPVLLLCGREDEIASGSEQIAAMLPMVEVAMVPGDHVSALQSVEFRELVTRFLASRHPSLSI